ncbi:stage III sporulation protein AF [Bacillaceae bacterium W0354]
MSYITEWVSQIVFFIFLATIISLLIPANSHEKIIKLVFGLVIFLLFLQPLIQLFNLNPNEMASSWELTNDSFIEDKLDDEISQKKSDIQAKQSAYILEQLETQIRNLIEEELRESYDVTVNDIVIQLPEGTPAQNTTEIHSITFYVSENSNDQIEEIERVTIPAQQPKNENKEHKNDKQIKKAIATKLDLSTEAIILVWEGA